MTQADAIIVGAGPAGGECGRALARAGYRVLLVEKEQDFAAKDFSSGGSTLKVLDDFNLPDHVVGAYCNKIKIASSDDAHCWQAGDPVALVLDFKKLRTFLAADVRKHHGTVLLGWSYESHEQRVRSAHVLLKERCTGKTQTCETRVLVDATGTERQVMAAGGRGGGRTIVGTGIELLVDVPHAVYRRHAETLSFFIGQKWMPQGYAWIFPMAQNRLKVGVGRNFPDEQIVPHARSLCFYLDRLIAACLKTNDLKILDRHGKTLAYTLHQRDRYFDQNLIAIGDAVSTVNPLTFEGIRHALNCGRVAAKHVVSYLEGKTPSFRRYRSEMRRSSGLRWVLSEALTYKIYREADDEKMTLMLEALKRFSLPELKDLFFDYRLGTAIKFSLSYQGLVAKKAFRLSGEKRDKAMNAKKS